LDWRIDIKSSEDDAPKRAEKTRSAAGSFGFCYPTAKAYDTQESAVSSENLSAHKSNILWDVFQKSGTKLPKRESKVQKKRRSAK
jgi:hypothetical protein